VAQALTIAIRYAVVRRQGPKNPQIISFQTHQHRLIPILAVCYAVGLTGRQLQESWTRELANQDNNPNGFLAILPDYHAISAGIKAWVGWWGTQALEITRRCMGGHGFSAYNAIAGLQADFAVMTQGGGDNVVLAQQTARYLLKSIRSVGRGKKKARGSTQYLEKLSELMHAQWPVETMDGIRNIPTLFRVLEALSIRCLLQAGGRLQEAVERGMKMGEAWNENQVAIVNSTRPHVWLYVARCFENSLKEEMSQENRRILETLLSLVLLWRFEEEIPSLLEFELITTKQVGIIRQGVLDLCKELRPDVIPLTDAFAYRDWILKAPLGCYDGDVYRKYFAAVNRAPGGRPGKAPYWDAFVKPLTSAKL